MSWRVISGDCVESMRAMPECSVDAVVTDPPYGLGFMGKAWDAADGPGDHPGRRTSALDAVNAGNARQGGRQRAGADYQRRQARDARAFGEWCEAWAAEALRVLKPGGHLLAFGGTRTYHRLAGGIEDAGFEIRDCLAWLYGSGFPKSLDVSKAIDKAAGAEREVVGTYTMPADSTAPGLAAAGHAGYEGGHGADRSITAPATPEAERWEGWGTALKPAHEPIVVARKPLAGTVASNVLAHGTGGLNIDGCRIGYASDADLAQTRSQNPGRDDLVTSDIYGAGRGQQSVNDAGRWPANVILDAEAAATLDEQTGPLGVAGNTPDSLGGEPEGSKSIFGIGMRGPSVVYDDRGGASRFFYVAKASTAERNAGLEGFEEQPKPYGGHGNGETDPISIEMGSQRTARNVHPTVKPIEVMRWLVRLVTPPGGTVLDPFNGSGTTGCAAVLEGMTYIGLEREAEYVAIAEARIAWWAEHPEGVELVKRLDAERTRAAVKDAGQLGMFDEEAAA